jgi:23S rRNA (uracil1939-C5)-methyltransferase
VRVTITGLDEDGRGIGASDDREIHVAGALPGETVDVEVEHESPHAARAWARMVAHVGPRAEARVMPACPGFGSCGGCVLQHLAYPAQLSEKRGRVEAALAAHPVVAHLAGSVDDVVASPRELHYRNKAKYVLAPGPRGAIVMGSYAPGTHEVVDMTGCRIPEEPIDEVARAAVRLVAAARLAPFDERTRAGELRYLVVRASARGQLLVVLVAHTAAPRAALASVAQRLRGDDPRVSGVVLNVNPTQGGALFGTTDILLDGEPTLRDTVGGVTLELSARSFFQVNRLAAAKLYAEVARAAAVRVGLRAIDLYSGVGAIALTLAQRGAQVVGIEVLEDAVADARSSAVAAGLDGRARFRAGYAGAAIPQAARELGGVDVIVVNPPRKGLGPEVRAALLAAAPPGLVYVSCGPRSLASDLADLLTRGRWRVERIRPFDLMPGTPHVETVVTLRR